MYQTFKKIITSIIPRKFIFENEIIFRTVYALFYNGDKYQCTICNKKLRKFIVLPNSDYLCPKCGSIKRNRRLYTLLKSEFLFTNSTVLDFSPSRCLYRKLKKTKNIIYKSTDLSGDFIADYQFDITNLKIPDSSLDLVICYHILEHIVDDIKAIHELFRVLKPGAKALVQTPFKEGTIFEDYNFTSHTDRLKYFGQEDHVRVYSIFGLRERLENCGFLVEIRAEYPVETKYGYDINETIIVVTKPLNK